MKNTNKNANNNIVTVGLINGRHNLPVDRFIFESIENVHDYKAISEYINRFIETEVGVEVSDYGPTFNMVGYADVELLVGKKELIVYVTGLTCVTAELIKACAMNGVRLTLMNYDRDSDSYIAQKIF